MGKDASTELPLWECATLALSRSGRVVGNGLKERKVKV
jgi:hypothetical protein